MKLVRLAKRPTDWDQLIQAFPNKTLFHEAAWLDYMHSIHPLGRTEHFEIVDGSSTVGYFCAVRVKKLLIDVWGSPLPGTGMYLGPLVHKDVDQFEVVRLIIDHCKENRIAHIELSNDWLKPEVMQALGFQVHANFTHICPLDGGVASVWARMKGTCRTRIRKAEKSGLAAQLTSDPAIVDWFYPRFVRGLEQKGVAPVYGIDTPRALLKHLLPAGRVFALTVKHGNEVIAAGFYPHDDQSMYYWDSAYDPDYLQLSPNELLHWTAMKLAMDRGIPLFNIGGGPNPSRFTQKFGGSTVPYVVYCKSILPFLSTAKRLYWFFDRQRYKIVQLIGGVERKLPQRAPGTKAGSDRAA